jgi:hypothetical protein
MYKKIEPHPREALKLRAKYTQADAERDHAAGNTSALVEAAYRIADGAAKQWAKFHGFRPPAEWYALAREIGCEKAPAWRPETKHPATGEPLPFKDLICLSVDSWADAQKYLYLKERDDPKATRNAELIGDEYIEENPEDNSGREVARALLGAVGQATLRKPSNAADDAERLDPKDDAQGGSRTERITRALTHRYRAPRYDATDEPGMLERFLARFGPVDATSIRAWITNSRPGTRKSISRYAQQSRPKKRFTDGERIEFGDQVWGHWEAFRDFAAHDVLDARPPVWDVRKDSDGHPLVVLPRGITVQQLFTRPDLLLSLATALDLGEITKRVWLAAHPGKLPAHFTNEWGQVLYVVKKLEMPPKSQN